MSPFLFESVRAFLTPESWLALLQVDNPDDIAGTFLLIDQLLSGSIRIHDPVKQARIFQLLGISDEEAKLRFGFLVDALKYGAPPMGGFALGFDRMIMVLTNRPIRDVIAFPKTTLAQSLMDGSPSPIERKLLTDLKIDLLPLDAGKP